MPVLQFKGKTAVETYHWTVPHHTLEFDKKLSVLGKNDKPGLDGNLIIEGDNLLALKALLPTHAGKVKCIYIDPPYNTGDEGWVFNDNLTQPQFKEWIGQTVGKESEDACRHDKWCCMMYPRLQLLKELLCEDGVILVSIDDNEIHHLRMLLVEVFGEDNFLETIIWQKSYGGGAKSKHFVRLHEYILAYCRDKSRIGRLTLPPDPKAREYYKHKDKKFKTRGPYRTQPLWTNSMDERKNLRFAIPHNGKEVWPEKQWQWSEDRVVEAIDEDELVFVESESGVSVYYKQYLLDEDGNERGAKPYSIIEGIYTQQGTNELNQVFDGQAKFKFPKPSALIGHLLEVFSTKGDIVLDCCAGSGTTGQAVLQLNKANGGSRRFVLVQQAFDSKDNEKERLNIAQEVARERIARVIAGYSYRKRSGKNGNNRITVDGLGGSFTYARLGPPLYGEYKNWGAKLPAFEDLARYIYYTETSQEFDPKALDEKSGKIGEHKGTAYYLLYTPNHKADKALDTAWLKEIAKAEKCKKLVVYSEKLWAHRDDLANWEKEHGKTLRSMLVPFNLR